MFLGIDQGWPTTTWPVSTWPTSGEPVPVVVEDFDRPAADWTMPFAQYQSLFAWRITGWDRQNDVLKLSLEELKTLLENKIPVNVWEQGDLDEANFTYPNLSDNAEGEPVPIPYGPVGKAVAYCVDTATKRFRMAGVAISGFTGFFDNDLAVNVDSSDTATASFIYTAWDGETEVTASYTGILSNPIDVLEDLLTTHLGFTASQLLTPGASDAEAGQGFGSDGARNKYIRGTNSRTGKEVSLAQIGMLISEQKKAQEYIETILLSCFAYMYQARSGKWTVKAWEPVQVKDVDLVLSGGEVHKVTWKGTAKDRFTKVTCRYKEQHAIDQWAAFSYERDDLRRARGLAVHAPTTADLPLVTKEDARWWTQRRVAMRGRPGRIVTAIVSQKALGVEPGQTVHLTYTPRNVDAVFLILGVKEIPGDGKVRLTLTEWHGFGTRPGWWAPASPVFPGGALGTGSMDPYDATWTDAQKTYYFRTYGVWLDANGIADDDVQSFERSVWI